MARPVNFAQASPSRLGEMKQGACLGFFARKVAQATRSTFARSRVAHALAFVLSPRRGEGSPEQARLA